MSVPQMQNHLLSSMTQADLGRLEPHLERVDLPVRFQLEHPHRTIPYIYFVETGLASVVAPTDRGRQVEVGIVGREGMTGLAVIFGDHRTPNATLMQTPGQAYRLPSDRMRTAIEASLSLRKLLISYAHAFMIQITYTALAAAEADVNHRVARCLLMAEDRLGYDLSLTHEYLSVMLNVRRAGVTGALQYLENLTLIRTRRGHVEITDRTGLERFTGRLYGVPENEYARLIKC
jgi:CRP-like cAMP-binding protein